MHSVSNISKNYANRLKYADKLKNKLVKPWYGLKSQLNTIYAGM